MEKRKALLHWQEEELKQQLMKLEVYNGSCVRAKTHLNLSMASNTLHKCLLVGPQYYCFFFFPKITWFTTDFHLVCEGTKRFPGSEPSGCWVLEDLRYFWVPWQPLESLLSRIQATHATFPLPLAEHFPGQYQWLQSCFHKALKDARDEIIPL